ncbi:MAG: hypothetical protein BGO70_01230 [Bacteroidetes bacterium 43-93]|uniref:hypothetical protein n=1 Tax=uncultured Dysgonomonas sp. TaxID=206096 RepID=UPI00092BC7CD|nr:hypothetical protein [uncultured Dysgonomonas sp.]MBN9483101.1 Mov34/MPN/PAD-1 family protein [Bacteroidota bacterium]OJW96334.1 MAG: hypothetical protein BGO70_01230 [Bacteroidetes bacterium 43-93]
MSTGFLNITHVVLPKSCAKVAIDALFAAGRKHVEGVALFAGTVNDTTFTITRTIVPRQLAGDVESGLIYVVAGEELHRIGVELFDAGLQLLAQIHSHPREAYHSDTDDAYPIVTTMGGISIVVPNFARGGINLNEWAIYRLDSNNLWCEVLHPEKASLIQISDDTTIKKTKKRTFKIWPWR